MKIVNWLKEEVKGWDILKFIFISIFLIFVLNYIAEGIINALGYQIPYPFAMTHIPIISMQLFSLILTQGQFEEVIFRLIPLSIATLILGRSKYVLIVAIISSIVFGIRHGDLFNIFKQGVGGFILCLMYLKCGGFQEGLIENLSKGAEKTSLGNYTVLFLGKHIKAFSTTSTAHILFNIAFFGIRFMSGMPYT